MKQFATAAVLLMSCMIVSHSQVRERLLMDHGWRFHLGDASSPERDFGYGTGALFAKAGEGIGAIKPGFNDSLWRVVDLPHDWVVELGFVESRDEDVMQHGFKPVGRQFPATSIGWYRRSFVIPKSDEGRRIVVSFDGVFRDCTVWLNNHLMGRNLSGYSGFSFDLTDYIRCGERNVLVVRADASQYEGWFYEGAGIYRHVWLIKSNPVHVSEYGVVVTSAMKERTAELSVQTEVENQQDESRSVEIESIILDESGKEVGRRRAPSETVLGWKSRDCKQMIVVPMPHMWSPDDPYCYSLISRIWSDGKLVDSVTTGFGIRTVVFDLAKGLLLNGKPIKVKGVCCHQDHAGVGSALPDRLQYYRIERLKEMGCNALRTSHNPPTPELLDACDRLGMLVLDENRLMGSSPEFMNQFDRQVRRDRNHPSVFLWSIGNEEWFIHNSDVGKRIALSLLQRLRELDTTRLATYAANNGNHYEGINSVIPVRGFNYMNIMDIDKYRKDHPNQFVIGSEEASTVCTRGVYANDTVRGYVSDYDINKPGWGSTAEHWWKFYSDREWLPGAFVWTGFDYRGEPTPYQWPCINSHFGIMDVCGFPKNNFYYYQSWWTNGDVLHIAPHWNWKGKEGTPVNVWCESNCDRVELLLNGKSLGSKTMERNSHLEWNVPYQPGVLEARGWRNGKQIVQKVETTDESYALKLKADRNKIGGDGEDVSVITVRCTDGKGRDIPDASNEIRLEVVGPGKVIGVGNGDPSSHEPDKYEDGKYRRKMFNGLCQVIVQSLRQSGTIVLRAYSDGLKEDSINIDVAALPRKPAVD